MNFYQQRLTPIVALILCCCLATPLPVMAETDAGPDRWKMGGSAYLWFSGIEATSVAGDKIDISFSDALDSLDGGIMGIVAAQKGRWILLADLQYLRIHDETSSTANVIGQPAEFNLDLKQTVFVSTFAVAYRVLGDDRTNLDLLAGGRYAKIDIDIDVDTAMGIIEASESETVLDGIVGGQAIAALNDRWYVYCYADVGVGDSKLTWQAWPGIGYRFKKLEVVAGYREVHWDTDDGDTLDDMKFKGPALGVRFPF
ncbi:MAG: hypothetical protein OEU56_24250 [Rhodospirillales bacterium]|jgi:hypothetical protein|nr:hypothetical protein [Rhodospirillales bacterium]